MSALCKQQFIYACTVCLKCMYMYALCGTACLVPFVARSVLKAARCMASPFIVRCSSSSNSSVSGSSLCRRLSADGDGDETFPDCMQINTAIELLSPSLGSLSYQHIAHVTLVVSYNPVGWDMISCQSIP